MTPRKRRLGTTDLEITTVGFGAWAVRRGVNWIDTAAIHGLGHSEEVVGRALRAMPASPFSLIRRDSGASMQRKAA